MKLFPRKSMKGKTVIKKTEEDMYDNLGETRAYIDKISIKFDKTGSSSQSKICQKMATSHRNAVYSAFLYSLSISSSITWDPKGGDLQALLTDDNTQ
jgi:hypothetical protein